MTVVEYVQQKGLAYRLQSGQVVLRECPFCGDAKSHFYMDQDKGAFFCHKCNEKGNLVTLKRHFGDHDRQAGNRPRKTPQGAVREAFSTKDDTKVTLSPERASRANERLRADPSALAYVTGRGISLKAVDHFKLGLEVDNTGRWLTIPHCADGKLVNIKSRSLPPAKKEFRRVAGCPSILFNQDVLKTEPVLVYLCEGETDAIALWGQGETNVIGVTAGAGSFLPEWIDLLQEVKKIVLCYDPDEPGQKGAREAARRLGYDRCYSLVMPDGLDINEYFRAGNDLGAFYELVKASRRFDVAGIMDFEGGLDQLQKELENPKPAAGIGTGFDDVDRIIKTGMLPGELIVLSAPPKIGKSTFALQIAANKALEGVPSLFYCLEMRPARIIEKIIKCHVRKENIGTGEIAEVRRAFRGKPLYLGYAYQRPTLAGTIETLRTAIRRYGLRLVVFDHLHFLVRTLDNQTQEIGQAVQAFKYLAEEMEIPIILIAQPRKIQAGAVMTAMDLKDSSSIFSDCDHLLILHRARRTSDGKEEVALQTESYDPVTMVRIEASRFNAGGECLLYYHGEYSRFDAMTRGNHEKTGL